MAETIEYTLHDGTVLVDDREGTTLADEVAFEHYFHLSSAVLSLQEAKRTEYDLACKAALEAGEETPEPSAEIYARTEWIAFFSWCRLCRKEPEKVAATFDDFIASVRRWEVVADPVKKDADIGDENSGEVDSVAAALIESGSGLDPTDQDPPLTSSPTSSSPASAGAAS